MTKLLEMQADRIEEVLNDFGVRAQVFGGQILPRVVSYLVQLGRGQRLRDLTNLHTELAIALQVSGVLVSIKDGSISIEVPRGDGKKVDFDQMVEGLRKIPAPHTTLLGVSDRGESLMLFMPSPNVSHVLIAGMTGSGKTELLCTMLAGLARWAKPREAKFLLVDPKQRKLASMAGLAAVQECCGVDHVPGLLDRLLTEMERRDAVEDHLPRLYLIIDEVADLVLLGGRPVEAALTRLVQRGREAGIHVIAATQRPSAGVIQGLMKANFPVRISGAVNSALDASIAMGVPNSGAERLLGKGDMVLAYHGRITRFQACMIRSPTKPQGLNKSSGLAGDMTQVLSKLRERLFIHKPGRPPKGVSKPMLAFATRQIELNGECSQRELRRWHQQNFGSDINPPRAAAAIQEARRLLNCEKEMG